MCGLRRSEIDSSYYIHTTDHCIEYNNIYSSMQESVIPQSYNSHSEAHYTVHTVKSSGEDCYGRLRDESVE